MVKERHGAVKRRQKQGASLRRSVKSRNNVGHGQVVGIEVRDRQNVVAIPGGHDVIDTQGRRLVGASELDEVLGRRVTTNEVSRKGRRDCKGWRTYELMNCMAVWEGLRADAVQRQQGEAVRADELRCGVERVYL